MIISVEKAKEFIKFPESWTDERIERKLKAVEQIIRSYTNNNFQNRLIRFKGAIVGQQIEGYDIFGIEAGDTIQISESVYNNGLHVVVSASDDVIETDDEVIDEAHVLVTKIEYPEDVIDCAINLLEWEVNNRDKVGIQSETLSRHSVSYFNMDGDNSLMGYPKSLLGCLVAYRKARC